MPATRQVLRKSHRFGPRVLFLPAAARDGAAHLRIYSLAEGLQEAGWTTLVLPASLALSERKRLTAAFAPDILFMQGARHPLNRPWLYPGCPIVFDMDDADFHLPHLSEPVRRAMPHVAGVIAGSSYVARWCRAAGAGAADVVWTGAPVSTRPRPLQKDRPPVVAWAQTRPMTYTVEAEMVRGVVRGLGARHDGGIILRLYDRQRGDDRAFASSFAAPGVAVEWVKKANYSDYLASFDDVSLGLAPLSLETPFSRGKSFGKVLAYLDRMVPVLASDACDHGRFFTEATAVLSNAPEVWVAEGAALLADPRRRQLQAEAAFWAFQTRLGLSAAVERVDRILRRIRFEHGYAPTPAAEILA